MKNPYLIFTALTAVSPAFTAEKPNILWITSEDHGIEMGCYGDPNASTPNVDGLASRGMIFNKAWSNAPVCAPARTTIISGMYPSSTGSEHMRSMLPMPAGKKMYPEFLREAGYYCTNNTKEDYNLRKPEGLWDESSQKAHWKNRSAGQPFFAIFNSTKSHESQIRTRPHKQVLDPAKVRVPAFHPDTPEVREDWAQYYDKVSEADADAGIVLRELAEAGLAGETIIFYYGDHGTGMPAGKRWPSNLGLQVPIVVYFPEKWIHLAPVEYQPGGKSDRLVSFVDLAPTLLSIAGIKPPDWMQGYAFAGPYQTKPQTYLHGFRGRMDERYDLVRSITDGRYVYLRNYMPHVSQGQYVAYQFETPSTRIWREWFDNGKTNAAQSKFWKTPKDPEELYDLQNDPDEVNNLAGSKEHASILKKLRKAQRKHLIAIQDVGFLPEGEMHERSAGNSPYDMARVKGKYPMKRILKAAEMASNLNPDNLSKLEKMLKDKDSAVRYWAAMGILMRGEDAVKNSSSDLKDAMNDASPYVRIAAVEALALYGSREEFTAAVASLGELIQPVQHGVFASLMALNTVRILGDKAAVLYPILNEMKTDVPPPDPRYNTYIDRVIESINQKMNFR
jgi:arylsulfatase A-like enzyme